MQVGVEPVVGPCSFVEPQQPDQNAHDQSSCDCKEKADASIFPDFGLGALLFFLGSELRDTHFHSFVSWIVAINGVGKLCDGKINLITGEMCKETLITRFRIVAESTPDLV